MTKSKISHRNNQVLMNEPKTFVQNELAKNEWICKLFNHEFD